MRLLVAVLLCMLTFSHVALGSQLESRELTIADIPPCGLRCLFLELPASGCSPTDVECVCSNEPLKFTLAACLLANCTMQDSLDTSRVQADLCDLSEQSRTHEVYLYTSIVYSIAFLSVVLRIAGKAVSKRLAWDDAMVVAALLLTAVPLGCVLAMATQGFGEHLWNLQDGKLLPILRYLYIAWSTYIIVLCMIKISLVLFYLEIFKSSRFQVTAYIFLAYMITNSLVNFFVAIFSCNPVPSFWDRDIKGKCLNVQASAYANSASAIVQDVILLILPLLFIRKLKMKRRRKIAVAFMFFIGTLGCLATIMRVPALSTFKISIDPSWDYVPTTIWTELELAAGFICVSLPSIRMLIVRTLPKRVKEFLTSITRLSRNQSRKTPHLQQAVPPEQRKWNKPKSWIDISANSTDYSKDRSTGGKELEHLTLGSAIRGSFMTSFWNRDSQSSQFSHLPNSHHRRLESVMSNYSESGVAVTRPPYQEERRNSAAEQLELLSVPLNSNRHTSTTEEHITALPRIGYMPEASCSDGDVTGKQLPSAQWQHHEKNAV